jgi:membrane associated rhomboid family serine protease
METRSLLDELEFQITNGKITIRLILINLAAFLLIMLSSILSSLDLFNSGLNSVFRFSTNVQEFLTAPWTLVLSIFGHFSLNHLFFNMLFLFFSGLMFEQLFGGKKLVILYLLGGIFGNILELIASQLMPEIFPNHYVIGASGSIMAIFAAVAIYRPKTPVYLLGIIPIPIYVLALFFLAKDLIGLGSKDEIAHFAHLGGAFIGFLAQLKPDNPTNLINVLSSGKFRNNSQKRTNPRFKTDEEFNADKKNTQERIDQILDKIAKSGYESLTRQEKEFLFKQGKQ